MAKETGSGESGQSSGEQSSGEQWEAFERAVKKLVSTPAKHRPSKEPESPKKERE
jgi:hypothetical protein